MKLSEEWTREQAIGCHSDLVRALPARPRANTITVCRAGGSCSQFYSNGGPLTIDPEKANSFASFSRKQRNGNAVPRIMQGVAGMKQAMPRIPEKY